LPTGLERLGAEPRELERPKYAARDAVRTDSTWNRLALGQHHGLPTRLLDWTFSPHVALHFMTSRLGTSTATESSGASTTRVPTSSCPNACATRFRAEGADVFTTEMLDAVGGLDEFAEPGEFVLFVEPPSFDERIVNQCALFSLRSPANASLGAWAESNPELVQAIVVPAELEWEIRDKLDPANVNERVLFPGLEGLTGWLKRYYLPRPGVRSRAVRAAPRRGATAAAP
jgi:hypothetical protein